MTEFRTERSFVGNRSIRGVRRYSAGSFAGCVSATFSENRHMFGNKTMKKPEPSNGSHAAPAFKPANGTHPQPPRTDDNIAPAATAKGQNVIGKGTVIEGNITADGDLRIEGTVRGDVTTKTALLMAQGSVIEGNLVAQHAEIAGEVHGTVQATGLLIIKSTGTIDGDVITTNLNVEAGSAFTGRFQVGPVKSSKASDAASVFANV
jgi:cytoskeletal protein CcmA (bactofilin family)